MTADGWCTLCGDAAKPGPGDPILEVKMLGPERRVHDSCWTELAGKGPQPDGFGREIMGAILAHEEEEGIGRWLLWRPDMSDPMSKYTVLIRSPVDPERSPRGAHRADWKELTAKGTETQWAEAILDLLLDGAPRTFNHICVELADITADVASQKTPEKALWSLVDMGALVWSERTPIRFRINDDPPALELGESYPKARGEGGMRITRVGGEAGKYWYTVREDVAANLTPKPDDVCTYGVDDDGTFRSYDKNEHALVPLLKLEG